MFVKVTPNIKGDGGNFASAANVVEYLDKENREVDNIKAGFFDKEQNEISASDALNAIDDNSKGLASDESKFFMLSINPSQNEMKHLCKKLFKKEVHDISELSGAEKEILESELREFTNQTMDLYALNFDKNLRNTDLVYKAVIEHKRHYNHRDKLVIENQSLQQEIRALQKEAEIIKDLNAYQKTVSQRINSLQEKLYKTSDGQAVVFDKELLDRQHAAIEDKQHLSSILDDKGMGIDQNTLQDLKDGLFDKETAAQITDYYKINKEIVWVKDPQKGSNRILTEKVMMDNERVLKEIQTQKDLLEIYSNKKGDNITQRIDALKAKLHRSTTGNVIKKGMLKPGFNSHVHVVVSRQTKKLLDKNGDRTIRAKKISPNANSRGHEQKNVDGTTRQTGFNHERFKEATNELFKKKFQYHSSKKESYQAKAVSATKRVAAAGASVMGEEFSKATNYSMQAANFVKLAMSANPKVLALNIAKKTVLKPLNKVSQEFKAILLKGQTLQR